MNICDIFITAISQFARMNAMFTDFKKKILNNFKQQKGNKFKGNFKSAKSPLLIKAGQ